MQFAKGSPTFANCKPRTVAKLHLNLFNHPVAQAIRIRAGGKALQRRRKGDCVAGKAVLLGLCSHKSGLFRAGLTR